MTDNNAVVAATSTKIEIFNNPSFGSVRAFVDENGEPWFYGNDVAKILGYSYLDNAIRDHVDEEDRKSLKYKASVKMAGSLWTNPNDFSSKIVISESGVYSLVFGSNLPSARQFERWVTKEVLPSIRKTGSYSVVKSPIERILANSVDQLEAVEAIKEVLLVEKQKQALIEARADKAEEAKAIAEQERDDVKEAFSRSVVSDNDKLYSTFIKELKMTNPCASSLLKELKIFGKNGHLSDYGDWFKIKVSDNGFPARFVTKLGQEMLIKLFNNNRDKMRAINGTYRYIKPQDRFKEIPEIEYM